MIKPNRLINYWIEKNGQRLWIQGTQPTSSNPVITTQSPLTKIAEAENAQIALNKASARGAFAVNAPDTSRPFTQDEWNRAGATIAESYNETYGEPIPNILPQYEQNQRVIASSQDRYEAAVSAEQERAKQLAGTDATSMASQEASRRFFNQLNESGISQDELMRLTGTTDAQKARD